MYFPFGKFLLPIQKTFHLLEYSFFLLTTLPELTVEVYLDSVKRFFRLLSTFFLLTKMIIFGFIMGRKNPYALLVHPRYWSESKPKQQTDRKLKQLPDLSTRNPWGATTLHSQRSWLTPARVLWFVCLFFEISFISFVDNVVRLTYCVNYLLNKQC